MDAYLISPKASVINALKQLDIAATKVLCVVDKDNILLGCITDGDIRRFILNGGDLNSAIVSIYNRNSISVRDSTTEKKEIKKLFLKNKIELLPVLDNRGVVVNYFTWDSVFTEEEVSVVKGTSLLNIPVVIMAGGKGTRLKPFTDVLPKPLVPIHEKPVMDWIIEEFYKYGARTYWATLNYRGKMIEAYYASIGKNYNIDFVWEDDFYGTAGSLNLLKEKIKGTFIVSNCDIVVKANYDDVLVFHKKSGAAMTVVSSIQHHQIPYGVLSFSEGGIVSRIEEKPEYTHAINTGVYILEPFCLDLIPKNEFYHITHLMEELIKRGDRVVTYPVNEKEYIDIGQWEEYKSAVESFSFE